ncbi:zinc finger protein 568-like, partial [Nothobranchius furzeri]
FPAAVQLVVLVKEEAFEELNAGVDQQDPEHFHIKEEQEELLTSLEGEQLNLMEIDDARFSFTSVSIKSEDDEEKPMFSQLHQQQIEDKHIPTSSSADQIKAETSERVETRRTPDLNPHEQTDSSDTEVSGDEENDDEDSELADSGPETGERDDDWNESRSSKTDVKWSLQKHVRVTNHSAIRSSGCLINNKLVKVTQRVDSCRKGRIKLKSYICDDCGKVFRDKSTLIAHIRVHTGQKPFACELCEQRFRQKSTLTIHMRVHTGQKPFACELCEQRFSHKTSLNNHMRIHTGEKPFACKICGQKFAQKTSFNGHMTVHTGQKPFVCELCGQSFSQKATLNRHMIVHSGEKPFDCELCGQKFSRKASLKNHMSVHTGQ